jgi:hypothetical protein
MYLYWVSYFFIYTESRHAECTYTECRILLLLNWMLSCLNVGKVSVLMLSVIMLHVIMLSVVAPYIYLPSQKGGKGSSAGRLNNEAMVVSNLGSML